MALVATLLLTIYSTLAQSVKVEAPQVVDLGRPFTVVYILQGAKGNVSIEREPDHKGLDKLYGPSTSQSSDVSVSSSGRVTSTTSFTITYTFLASEAGKYSVSGFRLNINGKDVSAPTATISARAGAGGSGRSRTSQPRLLFSAHVPRTTVYEQEALLVSYRVQGTVPYRVTDYKAPTHDGFLSQEVKQDEHTSIRNERIGGTDYFVADIGHEVLFAQHPGDLQIPSGSLSLIYNLPNPEDSFLPTTVEKTLSSSPVKITVRPLPTEGRPDDFSGAVGQFAIRYELSSKQWKTNEAVTLKVIISGEGNLKVAKTPELSLPSEVEVYDPIETADQSFAQGRLSSSRVIEYSLIPRHTGEVVLPAVRFTFFDPRASAYRTVSTEAIRVRVAQGRSIGQGEAAIISSTQDGNGNNPYGLLSATSSSSSADTNYWLYLLAHLTLLATAIGIYLYLVRQRALRADTIGYSASKAGRVATKRLRNAKKHLDAGATEALHEELLRALWGYLGDKLRMPLASLSRANISEELRRRAVEDQLIDQLTSTIDAIEFARFAPSTSGTNATELYQRVAKLISDIENYKLH